MNSKNLPVEWDFVTLLSSMFLRVFFFFFFSLSSFFWIGMRNEEKNRREHVLAARHLLDGGVT